MSGQALQHVFEIGVRINALHPAVAFRVLFRYRSSASDF
jgi:hypothetical protein